MLLMFLACVGSHQQKTLIQAWKPEPFRIAMNTSKGRILFDIHPQQAPKGVIRFRELIEVGYYNEVPIFRAIQGFMWQFGIHHDPSMNTKWRRNYIQDDPVRASNLKGTLTFASAGPNTRTVQLFVNTTDNISLDRMGFAPFGTVVEDPISGSGLDRVQSIYTGYGEGAPRGKGPMQGRLQEEGATYLKEFPKLDVIHNIVFCPPETEKDPCPLKD